MSWSLLAWNLEDQGRRQCGYKRTQLLFLVLQKKIPLVQTPQPWYLASEI
jgi:hypothetical protein